MIKFETFIFKNGKALGLYSKDGKRTNKGKDIYVDARQTADVLTVKAFRVKEWAARNNIAICDKLDASVEKAGFRKTRFFMNVHDFNACCYAMQKGDGRAIAQELTDALAVYMTDANQEED